MSNYIDPKVLESGNVLRYLKLEFLEQPSKETLFPFLECMRDSIVYVPMNAILSENDQLRLSNVKVGTRWKNEDEIRMRPDILKSPDGKLWFPVFTQKEQIPEDYNSGFSIMPMHILRCIGMAHATESVSGLVVDAFTEAASLPFEIVDIIPQLPSRLNPNQTRSENV